MANRSSTSSTSSTLSSAVPASIKDRLVVLCVYPFAQMLIGLYLYSCLPLHLTKKGIDLIWLGFCSASALATRTVLPIVAIRYVGLEKLVLPSLFLPLLTGALSCIFPDSTALLFLNVYCVMLLPARCVPQAAAVRVWRSERVKALRFYESFYTIGYCLSSLWGAAWYSLGGWKMCIWLQTGVIAATFLLCCTVRKLWPTCGGLHRSANPAVGAENLEHQAESIDDVKCASDDAKGKDERPEERRVWWYLAVFVCVGSAVYIFAYASEWSIYLVYLTDRFNMDVLPIGIGQMSGDLGGAAILMISMASDKRPACTSRNSEVVCGRCLFTLPWSMVWLGALYALAYVLFLSSTMAFAITGQVMMGTMYVLLQQGSSELVEWCSRGGKSVTPDGASTEEEQDSGYQSFAAVADAIFCIGCSIGSILPYILLDLLSADWVCYLAAGLISSYFLAYMLVFFCFGRFLQRSDKKQQCANEPAATSESTIVAIFNPAATDDSTIVAI